MEPCSILELSNTVLKVSWKVYKFFKAISDAPEEVYEYLHIPEATRGVIQSLEVYAESHERSLSTRSKGLSVAVVEKVLQDCELEFAMQLSYVEHLDPHAAPSFFKSTARKTKWVLGKDTLESLTKKLEKTQSLLHIAVTALNGSVCITP